MDAILTEDKKNKKIKALQIIYLVQERYKTVPSLHHLELMEVK